MDLKLSKLPDRVPAKLTILVMPDLHKDLSAYADLYRQTYGEDESVQTLIPFMLREFLKGDRGFAKVTKERSANRLSSEPKASRSRRHRTVDPASPADGKEP